MSKPPRWLAVVAQGQGYVLDVYDNAEVRRYRRQLGRYAIGEYGTPAEAWAAVRARMCEGHKIIKPYFVPFDARSAD